MPVKSLNFDSMKDSEILGLGEEVREAWSERDAAIARAVELRQQTWEVEVPKNWKQTAKTQHSSLPKEIAARVTGTMTLRDPMYSRTEPGDDQQLVNNVNQVERYLQGQFQYFDRTAVPGKRAWTFTMDNLINKGAVCTGSIFAPHSWAGVPSFLADDKVDKVWWRDEKGRDVEDEGEMDFAASARAYMKQVDLYRRMAKPPIIRRIIPPEHCYPMIIEGNTLGFYIFRSAPAIELSAGGFLVPREHEGRMFHEEDVFQNRDMELMEFVTPNRIRYFWHNQPLKHKVYGEEGVVTNYGFIPFSYRVGLEGGELEYGHYGEPLLGLLDTQLRMIDTLLTYQHNAIHLASFPSFKVKYTLKDGAGMAQVLNARTGKAVQTYQFKSGTVMDFGPDKDVETFTHPGMNKDFYEFLEFLMNEVNRVIPPTLSGVAASSGFNTVQASTQAKAIINPIADSGELLLEDMAYMDLQHIRKRVPGPIYLNLELPNGFSSKPRRAEKVKIDADMIGNYYEVSAFIDREIDKITLSGHLTSLKERGAPIGWDSILDAAGFPDPEEELMKSLRDEVYADPEIRAMLKQDVIDRFGLRKKREEAIANGRIVIDPETGIPMVRMADGRLAGPGQRQTPQGQGGAGSILGGSNLAALAGGPNNASTRRGPRAPRGGALAGRPQRQGSTRPVRQNAAGPVQ